LNSHMQWFSVIQWKKVYATYKTVLINYDYCLSLMTLNSSNGFTNWSFLTAPYYHPRSHQILPVASFIIVVCWHNNL
jgi:hypothetical protein